MCPPLPRLQDICSYLDIEKSGCCQVPVFARKPPSSSPYYLCSVCLSAGNTRKRNVKTGPSVRGCNHTAPPLELLQWRGLLFDGVEKVCESPESSSGSLIVVASGHDAPLHVLHSTPLSSSALLPSPPPLLSAGVSSSLFALSEASPSVSSHNGNPSPSSSSNSFAPSSMNLIPRRNSTDIATMPEFAASRKRKRLTENDILDEEGVPVLIPEWFQKQNIPSFFNFFIDFNLLRTASSSSSS